MSDEDVHPSEYNKLRSIYKCYIDSYNALFQLKTEKEEELKSIYKMIKTELIDSNRYQPKKVMQEILDIIPYNNRYAKSYLFLVKLISDDYLVTEVSSIEPVSIFLLYKEYGIKLDKSGDFLKANFENLEIHTENTIYRAIMNDDLKNSSYSQKEMNLIKIKHFNAIYIHILKKDIHYLNYVVTMELLIVSSC